jgi:D-lactate dehydrogenase
METFTKTFRDLSKNTLPKWSITMPKATNINIKF